MPLSSGPYTIRNVDSNRYLTSDGTDAPGTWVKTQDSAVTSASNTFSVVLVEGDKYQISAAQTGSYVGQKVTGAGNTWLAWSGDEATSWQIDEAGGGSYSVHPIEDSREWKNPNSDWKEYILIGARSGAQSTEWVFTPTSD